MVREKPPNGSWRQFIAAHMHATAACAFFVVPSLTFKPLFCLVSLSLDRRRMLHVDVTRHPTAEWAAQQLTEAFPGDAPIPRFLIKDRSSIYGEAFKRTAAPIDIELVTTARRMPRMNAYCEHVISTVRRECTDHVIAFGEAHLSRTLREYGRYYNEARPHSSLAGNSPIPRSVERRGDVISTLVLGGLHHVYRRAG